MKVAGVVVTTQGDREIVLTRDFNAPPSLVFETFTRPELIRRWMIGPPGHEMTVCETEPEPGGAFRYAWRRVATGEELVCTGEFLEVTSPERIVHRERFEMSEMSEPVAMGDATLVTTTFDQSGTGRTTVTMRCRYPSREIRDGVLASGMTQGLEAGYGRLAELLETMT